MAAGGDPVDGGAAVGAAPEEAEEVKCVDAVGVSPTPNDERRELLAIDAGQVLVRVDGNSDDGAGGEQALARGKVAGVEAAVEADHGEAAYAVLELGEAGGVSGADAGRLLHEGGDTGLEAGGGNGGHVENFYKQKTAYEIVAAQDVADSGGAL